VATRVFGRFVPAPGLAAAIREAAGRNAFAPGNGSALDDGARLAATALANRTGPRRVVLLTDELVRTTLAPGIALQALAALDPAIVVHVVVPEIDASEAKLLRDDDAPLAPLATKHHGIFARVSMNAGERELAKTVLELVRPIRIDHLHHDLKDRLVLEKSVKEGEGLRLFEAVTRKKAPTRLAISGQLWSDPITLSVSEDTTFSRATAGFVFGADMHQELSEMEMMVVALGGRAVSPVTSYLAIEPGVRPSKIGLEGGGPGWGTIGTGRYGTIGHGTRGSARRRPDLTSMIDTSACVKTHAPVVGWSVKLEVETTRDEIVDVKVRNGFGAMADCLVETAWRVRLDPRFDQERDTFVVDLL
jgi:hypothetical protein